MPNLIPIVALVWVHLFAARPPLSWLHGSRALSFAGGAATAYVFVHLLPALEKIAAELGRENGLWRDGEWVFVAALAGTCAFHALGTWTRRDGRSDVAAADMTFWVHVCAFAFYNFLVGAMLVLDPYDGLLETLVYQTALVLHFAVIDQSFREQYKTVYDVAARWIMAFSVVAGWLFGHSGGGGGLLGGVALAFLTGGMILNVLKEELSLLSPSRTGYFLFGAAVFGSFFLLSRLAFIP
ncbi:hypothetical protein [Aureimonas altamirensis]|uniref:hypothetical protein n=1 Tax=Aureimonas altamirensis TaxID=370622 RepID=UPI0018CD29DF|nr:hypothetical protein [Aureimonas altamirensis]